MTNDIGPTVADILRAAGYWSARSTDGTPAPRNKPTKVLDSLVAQALVANPSVLTACARTIARESVAQNGPARDFGDTASRKEALIAIKSCRRIGFAYRKAIANAVRIGNADAPEEDEALLKALAVAQARASRHVCSRLGASAQSIAERIVDEQRVAARTGNKGKLQEWHAWREAARPWLAQEALSDRRLARILKAEVLFESRLRRLEAAFHRFHATTAAAEELAKQFESMCLHYLASRPVPDARKAIECGHLELAASAQLSAKGGCGLDGLADASGLGLCGYRVGLAGLQDADRRALLDRFYLEDLPQVVTQRFGDRFGQPRSRVRLRKMVLLLSTNCRLRTADDPEKYKVAITSWETDLRYLRDKFYRPTMFPWPGDA